MSISERKHMKPFFIVLKNSNTHETFHRGVYWTRTFSEAAREAYFIRASKGYEWNISSIHIDTKFEMTSQS
jgi:hypothetical protein